MWARTAVLAIPMAGLPAGGVKPGTLEDILALEAMEQTWSANN